MFKYTTECKKCGHEHHYKVSIGKRYKCKKCKHTEFTQWNYGMSKPVVEKFDGFMYYYFCWRGHYHEEWRIRPEEQPRKCRKCGDEMYERKSTIVIGKV